jgi:hypothetical protein
MNRKSEAARYLHLIEKRLALVRDLRDVLLKSRDAIVAMNLEETDRRTSEQERLCAQIRATDANLAAAQSARAQQSGRAKQFGLSWLSSQADDPAILVKIRESMGALGELQIEVRKINAVNRSLIRRSSRTLNALVNFVNRFAPTYSDPKTALQPRGRF